MDLSFKPKYVGPSKGVLLAVFGAAALGGIAGNLTAAEGHRIIANTATLQEGSAGGCTNASILMTKDAQGKITMTLPPGCAFKK